MRSLGEDLQGHDPLELGLASFVDGPHASLAQLCQQLVLSQLADGGRFALRSARRTFGGEPGLPGHGHHAGYDLSAVRFLFVLVDDSRPAQPGDQRVVGIVQPGQRGLANRTGPHVVGDALRAILRKHPHAVGVNLFAARAVRTGHLSIPHLRFGPRGPKHRGPLRVKTQASDTTF
jgi:hypothetical protein